MPNFQSDARRAVADQMRFYPDTYEHATQAKSRIFCAAVTTHVPRGCARSLGSLRFFGLSFDVLDLGLGAAGVRVAWASCMGGGG